MGKNYGFARHLGPRELNYTTDKQDLVIQLSSFGKLIVDRQINSADSSWNKHELFNLLLWKTLIDEDELQNKLRLLKRVIGGYCSLGLNDKAIKPTIMKKEKLE